MYIQWWNTQEATTIEVYLEERGRSTRGSGNVEKPSDPAGSDGSARLTALCFLVHSTPEALILPFGRFLVVHYPHQPHLKYRVCPRGCIQTLLVHTWGLRAPLKDLTVTGVCKLGLSFGSPDLSRIVGFWAVCF